jgi:riboflavin synthase
MFTGLVEETGCVAAVTGTSGMKRIKVTCRLVLDDLKPGDSVALDGACQTVTDRDSSSFTVETLAETLKKTTLAEYAKGRIINLERAARADSRLGGHIVQGHVQGTGLIREVTKERLNRFLTVEYPGELGPGMIREGSVALDGISLTICRLTHRTLTVNIIPETWERTALSRWRKGGRINIETDMMLRDRISRPGGVSEDRLRQWGYS